MKDHNVIFKYHSLTILIIFMINLLFLKGIKSEVYTVGGEEQWNTEANFDSWSQQYNFSVGDVLAFKYTKGQHNVYEVTQATYRSCDASTGVLAKYESGNDEVTVTEAKRYWFICNIAGHCLGGMRLSIDVKEATSSNTTDAPNPQVEPPNNSCLRYAFQTWNIGVWVVSCAVLLFNCINR